MIRVCRWVILVPTMNASGGAREAARLGMDLKSAGVDASVLQMWGGGARPYPQPIRFDSLTSWSPRRVYAIGQLVWILIRFGRYVRTRSAGGNRLRIVFTHYITFVLAGFVRTVDRVYYVQDVEWRFVSAGWLQRMLRLWILRHYRRGSVITANSYLTKLLSSVGVEAALEVPVWADRFFGAASSVHRVVDYAMVVRKNQHKRPDLYFQFLERVGANGLSASVVTPDSSIADECRKSTSDILFKPDEDQMRALYVRTKFFVHLSDHEGFGLPPLEAMGAGCIPLCRDSGGVRAYMEDLADYGILFAAATPLAEIYDRSRQIAKQDALMSKISESAREVFERGLERTTHQRSSSIDALRRSLRLPLA